MNKYKVISDYDGNDSFEIEAENETEALREALNALGWWVSEPINDREEAE